VQILERRGEGIVAVFEARVSFVVAVDAAVQRVAEIDDGGIVDEIIQMLLRGARRLEGGFDGSVAQDGEG
jgi:hypothetical protein